MLVDLLAFGLIRAQAALAAACLLVLALRPSARRWFGAEPAYRLWALVPAASVASIFPSLADLVSHLSGAAQASGLQSWADRSYGRVDPRLVLALWCAGGCGFAFMALWSEARFRRRARRGLSGPAVVGLLSPRLYFPLVQQARFSVEERALVRLHEQAHIERGDPWANLLVVSLQCFAWCNPLAHVAARAARLDQELACDTRVVEQRPKLRRTYAQALLKAQVVARGAPLACGWAGFAGRHPLEMRALTIGRELRSEPRRALGLAIGVALAVIAGVAVLAWAPHTPLEVLR